MARIEKRLTELEKEKEIAGRGWEQEPESHMLVIIQKLTEASRNGVIFWILPIDSICLCHLLALGELRSNNAIKNPQVPVDGGHFTP